MTQAPTLSAEGRDLALRLIVSCGFDLFIGDVRGAFMESPPLAREGGKLYVTLPKGGIPGSSVRSDQVAEVILPLYD